MSEFTLEQAAAELEAMPGATMLEATHRDGEWSATVQWVEDPPAFAEGGIKPTRAHGNGPTLAAALETTLAEATRIRAANQA